MAPAASLVPCKCGRASGGVSVEGGTPTTTVGRNYSHLALVDGVLGVSVAMLVGTAARVGGTVGGFVIRADGLLQTTGRGGSLKM